MPRRQRRKTHSGPPSQTTTPVCFRIPNKLLAVLPQVAVVKSINGKRVFTPADPEASLTTLYKNRIIDVLVSDVASRVMLNQYAEPGIPSDKLPTDLVTDKQYSEWLYANSFLNCLTDDEAAGDGAIDWTTGKFVPRKKFAPFAYTTSAPAGTASPRGPDRLQVNHMPRRQRRKTNSGPPSKRTTSVCFRIPTKLLEALKSVAVVKTIQGKRIFTPADPEVSLTTFYKDRIIAVLVSDVATRVFLNACAVGPPDRNRDHGIVNRPHPIRDQRLVTDGQYIKWLQANSFLDRLTDDEAEAAGEGAIDWETGEFIPGPANIAAPHPEGSASADPSADRRVPPAGTAGADRRVPPAGTAGADRRVPPAGTAGADPSADPAGTPVPDPRREPRRDAKSKGLAGSE